MQTPMNFQRMHHGEYLLKGLFIVIGIFVRVFQFFCLTSLPCRTVRVKDNLPELTITFMKLTVFSRLFT